MIGRLRSISASATNRRGLLTLLFGKGRRKGLAPSFVVGDAASRVSTGKRDVLNGLRFCISRGGYIGRSIAERFDGFVGKLLVLCANLADGVMPAVVPTDARL